MSVRHRWFSFDGYTYTTHDSDAEARRDAEKALETLRDEACEGWAEEVEQIAWGRIHQDVVMTTERPRTDDDMVDASIDMIREYQLKDTPR